MIPTTPRRRVFSSASLWQARVLAWALGPTRTGVTRTWTIIASANVCRSPFKWYRPLFRRASRDASGHDTLVNQSWNGWTVGSASTSGESHEHPSVMSPYERVRLATASSCSSGRRFRHGAEDEHALRRRPVRREPHVKPETKKKKKEQGILTPGPTPQTDTMSLLVLLSAPHR